MAQLIGGIDLNIRELEKKKTKKRSYKVLRIIGKTLLGLVLLLLLIVLFIRSPWGQDIIKDRFISSLSEKTNTKIEVERLFVTFSGDIFLEGLYMEDKKGDTLIYSRELEADVPLWPIIQGGDIRVNSLTSNGLKANIIRQDSIRGFNYQFLMEAFAPADTTTAAPADTTSATRNFIIEEVDVKDLDLVFQDQVSGIDSEYHIGLLGVEMEVFDLENLDFRASNAILKDSRISYVQTKSGPEEENQEETPLPNIMVDELSLENVNAYYESVPDGILADLQLEDLALKLPEADLRNNVIKVSYFHLKGSEIAIQTSEATAQQEEETTEVNQGFQWPDWKIRVDEIILQKNQFVYGVKGAVEQEGFNPEAMEFNELDLHGNNIFLEGESAGGELSNISFRESSGINSQNSRFNLQIDDRSFFLDQLELDVNNNYLTGNLHLSYESLQDFIETPETALVEAEIPRFSFDVNDVFLFQPDLRSNEIVRDLSRKDLTGQIYATGRLSSLDISSSGINWGTSTNLEARGTLQNLTDPEQLRFNFPSLSLNSTRDDLMHFIEGDSLGVKLPEELALVGAFKGTAESMAADGELNSSLGQISFQGNYNVQKEIAFDAEVQVVGLDLAEILQNESFGNLNITINTSGQGESINTLDATLQSNISSFSYKGYPVTDVEITGEIVDGRGPISMDYRDENLNMAMENFVILDSVASQINTNLDVTGANLQDLRITSRAIKIGFGLDASFRGNADAFDINAEIVDGVTVYGNESYLLGDFLLSARVRPDSTALDIDNQILDVSLRSNTDPASFAQALKRHYRSYLSKTVEVDTVVNPVNLQLQAEIRENPILDEVFFAQLEEIDTIDITVDFHEKERELTADVEVPFLRYMGSEVDSLNLRLDSNRENFDIVFGFNGIDAGPLALPKTSLEGSVAQKKLLLEFNSWNGQEHLYHLRSEITRETDTVGLWLDPSRVILNGDLWEVPESNLIRVAKNFMAFEDFSFTREAEKIVVTDDRPDIAEEHIAMTFEDMSLAAFLAYFNPEAPLAAGKLNGRLVVENPFGTKGLLANTEINQFEVLEVPMGILTLDAEALSFNDYQFDLAIKEGNADLDLTGGFTAAPGGAEWYTELDLNRVEMELVEAFSFGEIKDTKGSFSGNLDLSGTFVDPEYEGQLVFNQAGFTVTKVGSPFEIREETIRVDTEAMYFDQFEILDRNSNTFVMNGEILTAKPLDPEFDLTFEAEDFMLLNSTRENNDLFYGTAVFDLEASLTGSLSVPNLIVDLDVGSESDLTYILPESEVAIERREGIVAFVNRENPEAILTATEEQTYALSGMEIKATISINEDAVLNVIIDEESGDNLQARGEGDLLFNIYSNGRMTLAGRYVMSGGHYDMNLYGLVNRKFEIVEGSSISWSGDPLDAHLDLRASYSVEASASSLMAPQLSGAAPSVRTRYRQELPFLVYLDIGGQLMQPVINFGLDMPEGEQGAVGGQVYGRVQQLNQQEHELNQQVFSLLVLNRFYPHSGSDGTGGGTLSLARDNLTDALSDQLNILSQDIIGGESSFALDFGLDSYTDYQGTRPEERTRLDITAEKAFMDERLVARVGSEVDILGSPAPGEETPLIGNVSLEYLIDEDGTWRIRGFRSNRFENVIEGQVIVSGIAFIFQKEFNKFRELFENIKKATEEQ